MPKLPLLDGVTFNDKETATCAAELLSARGYGRKYPSCGNIGRYALTWDSEARQLCGRHYRALFRNEINNSPNIIGMPPWYSYAASVIWRDITPTDIKEMLDAGWQPATAPLFPEIEPNPTDALYQGRMALPPDAPLPVLVIRGQQRYLNASVYRAQDFSALTDVVGASSVIYRMPRRCLVCGWSGSITQSIQTIDGPLGHAHVACLSWFLDNCEAIGYRHFLSCRHLVDVDSIPPDPETKSTDTTFTCLDCEGVFNKEEGGTPLPSVGDWCPTCVIRKGNPGFLNGQRVRCARCAIHVSNSTNLSMLSSRLLKRGVHALRQLPRDLADTYILMELSFLSEDAEPVLEVHAKNLAEELYNYSIHACGGELRYAYEERDVFGKLQLAPDPDTIGNWCPAINSHAPPHKSGYCGMQHQGVRVYGWLGGPPCPNEKLFLATSSYVANGRTYEAYNPKSTDTWKLISEALSRSNGSRLARFDAWDAWSVLMQGDKALECLEMCAHIFNYGYWRGAVGGSLWGTGAMLALQYMRGDISPLHYVDLVFGLQHNAGPFLNKCYHLRDVQRLLDIRRYSDSSEQLLPAASPYVWDLWVETYEHTKDDELYPGYVAIRNWRSNPNFQPSMTEAIVTERRRLTLKTERSTVYDRASSPDLRRLRAA